MRHARRFVSRLLNRPQLIEPSAAAAVIGALVPGAEMLAHPGPADPAGRDARDYQVTTAGTGMRVATLVDAWLIPDGGTSSNALHCGSTGLLEAQLHKAIATRLGQVAPGD